jgi:uncharacterized membrane protein (DUF4010 family)
LYAALRGAGALRKAPEKPRFHCRIPAVPFDVAALHGLLVAVLGGLAVGIERQWSGKAEGPQARFAGVRTFTLLALVAGLSGWLWAAGLRGPATVFLAGLGALVVVAYYAASRQDVDGTTEVAAFVVMVAAALAGMGLLRLASGIIAVTLLLLVEKRQLHSLVARLDREEIRAGARFAVMALVVLPLLPSGPYGPLGGVRPRLLWGLVLFFSGLSFLGYAARRVVGGNRGDTVAGLLGGLVSSTSVTLTFARLSQSRPTEGRALAAGVLGASAVLLPRVLVATAVLAPALTAALWPGFVLPALVGAAAVAGGLRDRGAAGHTAVDRNPLQFRAALQMALLFQLVLFGVAAANRFFGEAGLYGSAALLGLTDVDALTVSMAQLSVTGATTAAAAAEALTIGIAANTLVKLGIVLVAGQGAFRPFAAVGLALMAATLIAAVAAW